MQSKSDFAAAQIEGGFTCSTSVLLAFCEDYDLDPETAARVSCGLGGGCSAGEVCGAASGAALVIGLKYGQAALGDTAAKANCRSHVVQFMDEFKKRCGALTCRDLLECDPTTPEGHAVYLEKRGTVCFSAVRTAVGILEELGY